MFPHLATGRQPTSPTDASRQGVHHVVLHKHLRSCRPHPTLWKGVGRRWCRGTSMPTVIALHTTSERRFVSGRRIPRSAAPRCHHGSPSQCPTGGKKQWGGPILPQHVQVVRPPARHLTAAGARVIRVDDTTEGRTQRTRAKLIQHPLRLLHRRRKPGNNGPRQQGRRPRVHCVPAAPAAGAPTAATVAPPPAPPPPAQRQNNKATTVVDGRPTTASRKSSNAPGRAKTAGRRGGGAGPRGADRGDRSAAPRLPPTRAARKSRAKGW